MYVRDWDTDELTRSMTDSEAGLFIRCLNHSWVNYGLPADTEEIRQILPGKRSIKSFHRDWPRVAACFKTGAELATNSDATLAELATNSNANRLFNAKQEHQWRGQKAFSEKQSETAKSGWDKRKARLGIGGTRGGDSANPSGSSDATALPTQAQAQAQAQTQLSKGTHCRMFRDYGEGHDEEKGARSYPSGADDILDGFSRINEGQG
jgi:hypothetical protein